MIRSDSRGQFAALTVTIPDNYLKGIFGHFRRRRRTEKVDIRFRYHYGRDDEGALKGPFEVKVRNVLVDYPDRPVRGHAEYLDVMAEHLGLTYRHRSPMKQSRWYRFRDWKEALKVIDVVRGQIHVKAVAKHLTNLTRDELDNIDEETREKIRKAAMSWLNDSSVFADGIAVGLAFGWDDFFDLALEELSYKPRVFNFDSPGKDVVNDMDHKAKIAEVLHKYPVEINAGRVSKLKALIDQTDYEGLKHFLREFLVGRESEAD